MVYAKGQAFGKCEPLQMRHNYPGQCSAVCLMRNNTRDAIRGASLQAQKEAATAATACTNQSRTAPRCTSAIHGLNKSTSACARIGGNNEQSRNAARQSAKRVPVVPHAHGGAWSGNVPHRNAGSRARRGTGACTRPARTTQ